MYHLEQSSEDSLRRQENNNKERQFSPCSTMKINVSDLEIYTHRFNTVNGMNQSNIRLHSNTIPSRGNGTSGRSNLVNPCTIIYVSSNYSCFCDDDVNLKYFNQTNLDVQKIRCRFSYKDLALVYETSLLQTQQMQSVRTFTEKLFDLYALPSLSKYICSP